VAAADQGGPVPDLYQLLGVPREASPEEIAQAWRRRARVEHPDSRPRDAAVPGRFRALAEAYQVLSDPARRAAYDRSLQHDEPAARIAAATPVRLRWSASPAGPGAGPPLRTPGPPLRAGPVRMEGGYPARPVGGLDEQEARLAFLAELALWYLAGDRDRPW
jgi:curved DNA-binding protein CbpA